jgi:hypothetical protein
VINLVVGALALKMVNLGLGLHVLMLPIEDIKEFVNMLWTIYYVFTLGMIVSKTSALLFYTSVFTMSDTRFRYALWSVHVMNVAWFTATSISVTFICEPIQRIWDSTLQ